MSLRLDDTHDSSRRSFVDEANDPKTDFPIQNLPFGIFSTGEDSSPRVGVAIGDRVFDLNRAAALGLLPQTLVPFIADQPTLNALFGQGRAALRELRLAVATLLDAKASGNAAKAHAADLLVPIERCTMH